MSDNKKPSDDKKTIVVNLGLTGTCMYLAIGILYHLITGDGPFMWADPWLYVAMAFWPLFLFGWFLLVVCVIVIIVGILYYFLEERPRLKRRKEYLKRGRESFEERRRSAARAALPRTED